MKNFKFKLDATSDRKRGLSMIDFEVTRKELKNFISALKKLREGSRDKIVFVQDQFPNQITLQRFMRPPKKREWSTAEETKNGYKVILFDDPLEMLIEFYVDWLNHGLPECPAQELFVKFEGEEICLYFTHDAPSDRTLTKSG